jgi:hypothetical protein
VFLIVPIPRMRARRAAKRASVPPPSGPFALVPAGDGETALFSDARVGFTHALPAWPEAIHASAPNDPCDAAVEFWDLPVWMRYRLDRQTFAATSAMDLAVRHAQAVAYHASGAAQAVSPAPASQLAAWCVEAAATARYARWPDARGADAEDLTVLVRQGIIMTVARRHRRGAVDWVRLALFASAVDSTLLWDPSRARYAPRIWPEGTFLEPIAYPTLKPSRQQEIGPLAQQLARARPPQREALSGELAAILGASEAPWKPVGPEERAARVDALSRAAPDARGLFEGALVEVLHSHDLKGFAWMTGLALHQAARG